MHTEATLSANCACTPVHRGSKREWERERGGERWVESCRLSYVIHTLYKTTATVAAAYQIQFVFGYTNSDWALPFTLALTLTVLSHVWVLGAARKVEIKLSGHLVFGFAVLAKLAQPMSLRLGPSLANKFTMLSSRQAGWLEKSEKWRNAAHVYGMQKFFQAPKWFGELI